MKERHRAPFEMRSNSFLSEGQYSSVLPSGLVGPTSEVPVQIEGVYAKALLDSGSQVTILYRNFYNSYLAHLPLKPVENLEIWGLSSQKYPYDGYLPIRLEFTEGVVGVPQTVDTLALVCPDPKPDQHIAILVGTNTSLIRQLFNACKEKAGENFMSVLTVHPVVKAAYEYIQDSIGVTACADKPGVVWFIQHKPITLGPGEIRQIHGKPKLFSELFDKHVLIDQAIDSMAPEELLVRPELQPASAVSNRMVTVTVKNMSSKEVLLKRGTPIAHIFQVDVVPQLTTQSDMSGPNTSLSPDSFDFGSSPIPEEAKQRLIKKLMEKSDVFSAHEWDVGCSKSTVHEIRLSDSTPFRERSRRLAPKDLEDVRKHLLGLQKCGIISESKSPYASPIVVVRKKSGSVRMCVDYRTLNRRTIPDQYTVPKIEDALHCLSGSKWFSVLDLRSGYYQIPMSKDDKEKTAFICPLGFFEFERMPQGISGAPATFQRVMERTVGDMNFLEVLVYLDDLIIFGKTIEEHEERLLKVLDRLRDEGLKLSLDKCQFCRTSVTYVGHIVSQEGIATDPSKVEAVVTWPRPKTVTELRSFLGFCGYYRRFVKGYSSLCRPLNQLLKGYQSHSQQKEKLAKTSTTEYFKRNDPFESRWDDSCERAFQELKLSLTQAPVLAFADPQLPYVLHVDASLDGLGGVLYQQHAEGLRPVAFISRSLSPSEKNYPAHKLEFLALKWAVVDKLHEYLYGATFEVRTDNNPLTYILVSAKLDATGHRWLSALSTYTFSLKYRPGRKNVDADSLSRRPHFDMTPDEDWQEISAPGVRSMCQSVLTHPHLETLGALPGPNSPHVEVSKVLGSVVSFAQSEPRNSDSEMREAQEKDPCLSRVLLAISQKQPPSSVNFDHPDLKVLKRQWGNLVVDKGLLFRVVTSNKQEKRQLVLPNALRSSVLTSLHDQSGHFGFDKTYALIKDRFFWPDMKAEVEGYCKSCERCIVRKTLPQKNAPMCHMQSSSPLDLVCIDFLTIEPDSRNVCNVLVVTDHFTRYAQAFPTKDQKALTVARTLCEKYFVHYGLPNRIHSDQGRDFESRLIRDMLSVLGIKKSRTSPYHPQGDPQPERFNRTLLNMLGTLDPQQKSKWSQFIPQLVHAYNCTHNESTGYSPYFLMFGREPKLPIDICFGVSDEEGSVSPFSYVKNLNKDLKNAYELAAVSAGKRNQSNKRRYDKEVHDCELCPGDRVFIKNLGLKGKHKLADRWSSVIYVVEKQLPHLPVYQLVPECKGPKKVLHRNHILPIKSQIRLRQGNEEHSVQRTPRASKRLKEKEKKSQVTETTVGMSQDACSSDSDSESVHWPCVIRDPTPVEIGRPKVQDVSVVTEVLPEQVDADSVPREVSDSDFVDHEVVEAVPEGKDAQDSNTQRGITTEYVPEICSETRTHSQLRRSERDRKPPNRFTYPQLGIPSKEAVVVSKCGEAYFPEVKSACKMWWCNPHAMCKLCLMTVKTLPCFVPRL